MKKVTKWLYVLVVLLIAGWSGGAGGANNNLVDSFGGTS
jgi:hypothetical protein